jgi:ATP-dependent DNA helicase RecQ
VLLGQSTEKVLQRGHDALSVFGIVEGEEGQLIKPVARALQLRDALRTSEHGGLEFGPEARAILKGEQQLDLVLPPVRERRRKRDGSANPVGDPLFEALRARRRDLAQEADVPPYVIFHDSTLREMATIRPINLAALGRISGIGARKLEAYGAAFLETIMEFEGR